VDLFPADMRAIAAEMDKMMRWGNSTRHEVTVAAMLADPFRKG
jgi:hypothetical protein